MKIKREKSIKGKLLDLIVFLHLFASPKWCGRKSKFLTCQEGMKTGWESQKGDRGPMAKSWLLFQPETWRQHSCILKKSLEPKIQAKLQTLRNNGHFVTRARLDKWYLGKMPAQDNFRARAGSGPSLPNTGDNCIWFLEPRPHPLEDMVGEIEPG